MLSSPRSSIAHCAAVNQILKLFYCPSPAQPSPPPPQHCTLSPPRCCLEVLDTLIHVDTVGRGYRQSVVTVVYIVCGQCWAAGELRADCKWRVIDVLHLARPLAVAGAGTTISICISTHHSTIHIPTHNVHIHTTYNNIQHHILI